MNLSPEELQELLSFGAVKWVESLPGVSVKGWFILETNPLPPLSDRLSVVADIISDDPSSPVRVAIGGRLYHSEKCTVTNHDISTTVIPESLIATITTIPDITFKVAIHLPELLYPTAPKILGGQPIVIGLEPKINFVAYPDHPHLNGVSPHPIARDFMIPESFCYTDNPSSLGSDPYHKLHNTFIQVCIWLFRHQVWLETRKHVKPGIWIGPHKLSIPPLGYAVYLNPLGKCRCGKDKAYVNCCWATDLGLTRFSSYGLLLNAEQRTMEWAKKIGGPQFESLNNLTKAL